MDETQKAQLLAEAKTHIKATAEVLHQTVERLDRSVAAGDEQLFLQTESETAFEDELRARAASLNTGQLREQMAQLADSPYFARCDLEFEDEPLRPYYFSKYSASELGIYSWTSEAAALRFETPGDVAYQTPFEGQRAGRLHRRDQYMIARGHLNFMTTEGIGAERELIYQEHFSSRKTGFVLPEVVAQMEKAQDQVIRANYRGPFVISGPAGSGKTTLALHRVAYLRQSPETAELYPAESMLVLVQDAATEDYFAHLLPELGIHDVQITTFPQWAIRVLGLGRYFVHLRPGLNEAMRDRYEYAKLQALRAPLPEASARELKTPAGLLQRHYASYLDDAQMALLAEELEEGALDRYDLILLLRCKQRIEGRLMQLKEEKAYLPGGRTKVTLQPVPLEYALVLIDEFQNYLPEQLRLLQGVSSPERSTLYVGDSAQQTQFGALSTLADIGEAVAPERLIRLQKVYRNTRQILEYVQALEYEADIPAGIADGPAVTEHQTVDVVAALEYIVGLTRRPGSVIGVIAKSPEQLVTYREYFNDNPSVRCMTMREAQGVEFDIVCLVEIDETTFVLDDDPGLAAAQQRVYRDLLYVALTRAMSELHVLGRGDLRRCLTLSAGE